MRYSKPGRVSTKHPAALHKRVRMCLYKMNEPWAVLVCGLNGARNAGTVRLSRYCLSGSKTMVYDWDGARTRRVRLFKMSAALLLATAVAAVPLFFWALQIRGL
jgi:hypothetical protein